MTEIGERYRGRDAACFRRKATLDQDLRPGELAAAVSRAKGGDQDAIRYLYLRFADNVYGYACSILRDEHEAEDVTQQVFARLMTALARYEQRAVPFSAWILRITHNLAIDHMRRRRAIPCEEVHSVDEASDEDRHQLSQVLREAIAGLPEDQRTVVVLRHVHGWSPNEIATRINRSEDAVHGLHHRGRRALKEALRLADAAPATAAA